MGHETSIITTSSEKNAPQRRRLWPSQDKEICHSDWWCIRDTLSLRLKNGIWMVSVDLVFAQSVKDHMKIANMALILPSVNTSMSSIYVRTSPRLAIPCPWVRQTYKTLLCPNLINQIWTRLNGSWKLTFFFWGGGGILWYFVERKAGTSIQGAEKSGFSHPAQNVLNAWKWIYHWSSHSTECTIAATKAVYAIFLGHQHYKWRPLWNRAGNNPIM